MAKLFKTVYIHSFLQLGGQGERKNTFTAFICTRAKDAL